MTAAVREPSRLALEVTFDSEPIKGRLYDRGRLNRSFSGWLGLMAAIEAARPARAPAVEQGKERDESQGI